MCDDRWDMNDAKVACRQLGFSGASFAPISAAFGKGSGPILTDRINCHGTELSLLNCPADKQGPHHCNHYQDASVVCY